MKKNGKVILAVISAACIALTACSKDTADTSASETAETATSETASAVEYDLGLDDDGYFRDVTASKYIKMPKDYKKYTVSKDVYAVTDDEIQSELDYFQSNYKLTTEVTDRAAQEGDVVNIDYEGTVDGVAFTGGTTEDYDLELGSNTFIDGFEEQRLLKDISYEEMPEFEFDDDASHLLFRAMCGLMMGIFLSSGCMTVLVARQKSFWLFAAPIFMMITRTGIIPWILIVNLKGE